MLSSLTYNKTNHHSYHTTNSYLAYLTHQSFNEKVISSPSKIFGEAQTHHHVLYIIKTAGRTLYAAIEQNFLDMPHITTYVCVISS